MKKFWNWVRDEDTGSRTIYLNLLLLLFLIEQGDMLEHYEAAKQGFERMV